MKHKFRFTIRRKQTFGFGVIFITVLFSSIFTYHTLNKALDENRSVRETYTPTKAQLFSLHMHISESKTLINNWVYQGQQMDESEKNKLSRIHNIIYPEIKDSIAEYAIKWKKNEKQLYSNLCLSIDSLFDAHKTIMTSLNSFESYSDPLIMLQITPQIEEDGRVMLLFDRISKNLEKLLENQEAILQQGNDHMEKTLLKLKNTLKFITLGMIFWIFVIGKITIRFFTKPLEFFNNVITQMGNGIFPTKNLKVHNDEIGDMSIALNNLVKNLKENAEFAAEIGSGNLQAYFRPLCNSDVLGNSLIEMQKSLVKADDEDKKHEEEEHKRNWVTEGLAMSGDILRTNYGDFVDLSNEIMKLLVDYLDIEQGGLYYYNDDDKNDSYLELIASKAFNIEKNLKRKIYLNDGLIGYCVTDKKIKHITDLPDDYLKISSGSGETKPRSLLIVPIIWEGKINGAIELASLKTFKEYEVAFVERLAYRIAGTFSSMKNNQRTVELLEQTQLQAEQLSAQEEELRQNLEELQATQDEMIKAQNELQIANIQLKKNEEGLEEKVKTRTTKITEQAEHMKQANQEILAFNKALEQQKEELQVALENLKQTQSKLVQSEKMASLGQLIAGIAHEINTPLGAIKSSIGTIADALNKSVNQLPDLIHKLTAERLKVFYTLIDKSMEDTKLYTSREERKFKRKLRRQLEDIGIVDAENIADTLIDMNIHCDIENFIPLFRDVNIDLILNTAYNLSLQHKNSSNIKIAVERVSKIVFALKSYSYQANSTVQIKTNIVEGLETVLTLYHNQLKQGIEVIKQFETIPDINCYPDELNQVWTNIIHNAIHAMNNNGELTISIKQVNENVEICISDTGKGIPKDIQDRIFEPFFTTKATGEGTGLGLDIVLKIIQKHNGTINVESEEGKGSTFKILLPATF